MNLAFDEVPPDRSKGEPNYKESLSGSPFFMR